VGSAISLIAQFAAAILARFVAVGGLGFLFQPHGVHCCLEFLTPAKPTP